VAGLDDDEAKAVGRDELIASRVVDGSLLASVHSAQGQHLRAGRRAWGTVVLELSVLHPGVEVGPVAVSGEAQELAVHIRVAEEPIEFDSR
jgi:hypothetical protein